MMQLHYKGTVTFGAPPRGRLRSSEAEPQTLHVTVTCNRLDIEATPIPMVRLVR